MSVPRAVTSLKALKVRNGYRVALPEHVATEAPMQILVAGPRQVPAPLAVTMRTPGHDFDLAAGFVITEGVASPSSITAVSYCTDPERIGADRFGPVDEESRFNHVTVHVAEPFDIAGRERYFGVSASCGVCGKRSVDQVELECGAVGPAPPIPPEVVVRLPEELRSGQRGFDRTGGLHAAGLFDPGGRPWCVREDVGRHNAVDKVIGHMALAVGEWDPDDLAGRILIVSGRVSFEIVQKVAVAGIGTIAAISAPSSLAVDAAERLGIALVAFVRGDGFNIYSHPERITALR
jgi:FdhD protein